MDSRADEVNGVACVACGSTKLSNCAELQRFEELRAWSFLRCDRCGTARTVAASTGTDVHAANNALYDIDDEYSQRVHGEYYRQRNLDDASWILRRIGRTSPQSPQRYLDIGCSGGGMMAAFASLGYEVYGIEPSAAVSHAPPELASRIQRCFFGEETFNQTFDLISAFHVLEHVPSPTTFVEHCFELLVPGGVLVIEVPNFDFALQHLHDDQHEAFSQISPRYHLNQFTMEGLELLLRRNGFVVFRQDRVAIYKRSAIPSAGNQSAQPVTIPEPVNASPAAISLRSRVTQVIWGSRFLRMRLRHALAHTYRKGRYIRIYARAQRKGIAR